MIHCYLELKDTNYNLIDNFIKSGGDFIKNEITEINTLGNNLELISDKEKYNFIKAIFKSTWDFLDRIFLFCFKKV